MNYIQTLNEWFFYFLKQHGIVKTLKGIMLYHYRILKLLKIDVSKEHVVELIHHHYRDTCTKLYSVLDYRFGT